MKILLINPPRSLENNIYQYASEPAKKYIHQKLIGPPLGLLTVAAAVKDYDVSVYDLKAVYDLNPQSGPFIDLLLEKLNDFNPDIVGVTFIASEFNSGMKIMQIVKEFNPRILTVAGGLHVTLCPGHFERKEVDIVCPGESAHIFKAIVQAKENKVDFQNIGGILINNNGRLTRTKSSARKYFSATKDFIMPERSFIKEWIQAYKIQGKIGPVTYIFTSLGCPYECSFCSIWPQYQGHFYQRDVECIIRELKTLGPEYKVVRFADANTIVNVPFINQLCDRIMEEGISKDFVMDVRIDTVVNYPQMIEKLAKTGLKVVICGFESFREEELKEYKKSVSAKLIHKAIRILHSNGVRIRGNYVVPHYYTENDFNALADYSGSNKVVYAGYTILTPMPGTVYYAQVKDQIVDFNLDKYNFFNCVLKTKLPLNEFYKQVGKLWLIKEGTETI